MLSLVVHVGMKVANIAKKYIKKVSSLCDCFCNDCLYNHKKKHFIVYTNILFLSL